MLDKRARFINVVNSAMSGMYKIATPGMAGNVNNDEDFGATRQAQFETSPEGMKQKQDYYAGRMARDAKSLKNMARGDAAMGGALGAAGGAGAAYILAKILKLKKAWIYALGGGALGGAAGAMGGGKAMNAMRGWLDKRHAKRTGLTSDMNSNLKALETNINARPMDAEGLWKYLARFNPKQRGLYEQYAANSAYNGPEEPTPAHFAGGDE